MAQKFCCEKFGQATQYGTDNEGTDSLIGPNISNNMENGFWGFDGRWIMGNSAEYSFIINFCPFCGKTPVDKEFDGEG